MVLTNVSTHERVTLREFHAGLSLPICVGACSVVTGVSCTVCGHAALAGGSYSV